MSFTSTARPNSNDLDSIFSPESGPISVAYLGVALILLVVGLLLMLHPKPPSPMPMVAMPVYHHFVVRKGDNPTRLIGYQHAIEVASQNGIPIIERSFRGPAHRITAIDALMANTDHNLVRVTLYPGDRLDEQPDGTYRYTPAHPRHFAR